MAGYDIDWTAALGWLAWADTASKAYSALGWLLAVAWLLWGLRRPLGASLRLLGRLVAWPVVAPAMAIRKALTPLPPPPPPPLGELAAAIVGILREGPCEIRDVGGRPGVRVEGRAAVCLDGGSGRGWQVLLGPDALDVTGRLGFLNGTDAEAVYAAAKEAKERIEADRVAVALKKAWVAGRERDGEADAGPPIARCLCGPGCDCETCRCGEVELAFDGDEAEGPSLPAVAMAHARCKGTGRVREGGANAGGGSWRIDVPCKGCRDCDKDASARPDVSMRRVPPQDGSGTAPATQPVLARGCQCSRCNE